MTEDSFGKLMMLLVIKDSRVLEKKFLTGENIPYQYPHSASSLSCKGACGGSGGQKEWQVRKMILHIVTDG